ncbi:MAG: cytidylate kinase-like family protein [Magnetococcales bacterium]|nr:cytidylate kinase-like family protein [Magnetococcales bacterium]NGZ27842.1 cytidylate kinase-like family protein [Magnetococcales bacterium]
MFDRSPEAVIQSLVSAELYSEGHLKEDGSPMVPLVTVSRSCGSNGTLIAQQLSERLKVRFYDKELLNEIVKVAKGDKYLLERLDEHATTLMDELIHTFFAKKGVSRHDFHHYLIKVVLGISRTGGVIVGRGAHLLVPHPRVFRLRLEGSLPICAKRIAERMGVKPAKAEKIILKTDADRDEFVKKIFKSYPTKRIFYDLVVNTDNFTTQQVVNIVAVAMAEAGFAVPEITPAAAQE